MALSLDAYVSQLKHLLPPGRLFRLEAGTKLVNLLKAIADELVRVDGRGDDLIDETDPSTAVETLENWERILGIPDECIVTIPTSVSERQIACAQKYTAAGGSDEAYFIQLAATLGYGITISYYDVCRSGVMRSGDRCYGTLWAYAWLVTIPLAEIGALGVPARFRSGQSHSGDRLIGFGSLDIACVFDRAKPAHTVVLFQYV